MKKIIKDENGFSYQFVGEVYYPILTGAELPIGIYAQERLDYLKYNFPKAYKHLTETKSSYRKNLFELNCLCEQEFQKHYEHYLHENPNINKVQKRDAINKIRKQIFEIYIHQPKGSESDETK